MFIARAACNPLITPADVTPSSPDLRVVCAFNPAAIRHNGETLLLLRVAETARTVSPDEVAVPVVDCQGDTPCIRVERFSRNTPGLDLSDSRAIVLEDRFLLTSLSHLRLARSTDGVHFTIDDQPSLFPTEEYEEYGIEDPRITEIDGIYYVTYTAVSRWGIAVGLASTTDFVNYIRHGLIFGPDNKDVVLFPEKINGRYYAMHRPATGGVGSLKIWLSSSPDMHHWGGHRPVLSMRQHMWDGQRIGAGDVPIKTGRGWLEIYHGVSRDRGYALGAVLFDLDDPYRVIARSEEALLSPQAEYECVGFYGNVVFTCGSVLDDAGMYQVYYGAADAFTCRATFELQEILDSLQPAEMVTA